MMTIAEKIAQIRQQIPDSVKIVAVTKQVSVERIREAYAAGIRDFGENRLQEALSKQEQLQDLTDVCWHFIGHLQSNKAKKAIESFHWIHSVDSLSLAQRLNRLAQDFPHSPQICLQVKPLSDPNKYGWDFEELLHDISILEQCHALKIRGLMTILPLGLSEKEALDGFKQVNQLANTITQRSSLSLEQLSMGMSGDYLLAIEAGSTMIRPGRQIFGERSQ